MTVIAMRCPACRTTDAVPPSALLVDVNTVTDDASCAAAVAWICAGCHELVCAPVEWAPLLAMIGAGAVLLDSAEVDEPSGAGPA